MKPLVAQNGLEYHVDLKFSIAVSNSQNQIFQLLFEKLVTSKNTINDEGMMIQFNLNVNEEIGKFGRFKDVPGKTEIQQYMPIILSSPTYLGSDIVFLANLIKNYIEKEKFQKRKVPVDAIMLDKKIIDALENPTIMIKNLVLTKKHKKS
ncbi:hypothetical protein [Alkaliphilus hydrothermalis]|uniref:Uncharacterized protein n=1 Tax=Alkaliphilus hydrothermalis TaxID=1482730 RepID=A0ABS2NS63_9FIRM|nr:hypothetical protein [Alkaliphilus hydrothermalis]MBM7615778.1 hypothetical protein [Alkaliphilus hydrothermalis]